MGGRVGWVKTRRRFEMKVLLLGRCASLVNTVVVSQSWWWWWWRRLPYRFLALTLKAETILAVVVRVFFFFFFFLLSFLGGGGGGGGGGFVIVVVCVFLVCVFFFSCVHIASISLMLFLVGSHSFVPHLVLAAKSWQTDVGLTVT